MVPIDEETGKESSEMPMQNIRTTIFQKGADGSDFRVSGTGRGLAGRFEEVFGNSESGVPPFRTRKASLSDSRRPLLMNLLATFRLLDIESSRPNLQERLFLLQEKGPEVFRSLMEVFFIYTGNCYCFVCCDRLLCEFF
jgi:hypothetical protein